MLWGLQTIIVYSNCFQVQSSEFNVLCILPALPVDPCVMMEKFCTWVSNTHLWNAANETEELNFIVDLN